MIIQNAFKNFRCIFKDNITVGFSAKSAEHHYENLPMQYTEIFFSCKNRKFYQKNVDIFLIFAQNIDCGYTLELPRQGSSNKYPQSMFWSKNKMSRIMRKPDFCLCENKGADQLRGNLCFRYTDSIFPPLLKSEISSF